jgi:cell filamentation protein, protein adenylyltransferase
MALYQCIFNKKKLTMEKSAGKYHVSEIEDFEPGSNKQVLRNLHHITNVDEIDRLEAQQLVYSYDKFIEHYDATHSFTESDIKAMHRHWLGKIYPFAGQYRTVNMSKADFLFATASLVPKLMENFEKDILKKYTPCTHFTSEEIISALAITHTELILIHPFREGNGRLARLLATLMGLQGGLPILNFECITAKVIDKYISAVQSGLDKNYQPMEDFFSLVIDYTQRNLT